MKEGSDHPPDTHAAAAHPELVARYAGAGRVPAAARRYLEEAFSENTRRAYQAGLRHFLAWGGRVPATPELVAEYLAAHGGVLSVATLQSRLAAIRLAHAGLIAEGQPDPTATDLVRSVLRGIRRLHGRPQRKARPITLEELLAVLEGLGRRLIDLRDRALLLTGFFGAFRRSELAGLEVSDLDFREEGVVITVRRSKTDQEGEGEAVAIAAAQGRLCVVAALREWLEQAGIEEGSVFRAVDRRDKVSQRPLSVNGINQIVKRHVARIGRDPDEYSAHSLRAGFATAAARLGVEERLIQRQTRHRSVTVLRGYIREGELFRDNAGRAVLDGLAAISEREVLPVQPNPIERGPR